MRRPARSCWRGTHLNGSGSSEWHRGGGQWDGGGEGEVNGGFRQRVDGIGGGACNILFPLPNLEVRHGASCTRAFNAAPLNRLGQWTAHFPPSLVVRGGRGGDSLERRFSKDHQRGQRLDCEQPAPKLSLGQINIINLP